MAVMKIQLRLTLLAGKKMKVDFQYRVKCGESYFNELDKVLSHDWIDSYSVDRSIFTKLALIHPENLHALDLTEQQLLEINGPRNFKKSTFHRECQSDLIWGYKCLSTECLQQDHLFPYSLGGATNTKNRIFLCKNHNSIKGHDIHLYPWEFFDRYTDTWLHKKIELIRNFCS